MARWAASLGVFVVLGGAIVVGCGTDGGDSTFDPNAGSSGGENGNGGGGFGGDPGSSGNSSGGSTPCVGLQCQQVACSGSATTSLSGKVYDPSGTVPLYNAVVYVPNADLDPFPSGITCDRCGTAPSGKPVTTALTNSKGEFKLENVPVGVDVPLVVQVGRWRRKVTIPSADVAKCEDRGLAADVTRLPRSRAEGEIPKIAITTGEADSLECFVRKLGVDASEFTNPADGGRINIFQGKRTDNGNPKDGSRIDAQTPAATTLWNSVDELKKYDMVILSCEGAENNATKSTDAKNNLRTYLDAGGRVFASHFHYTWYKNNSDTNLKNTATWVGNGDVGNAQVSVDTSFAKGRAFSEWLDAVSATTAPQSNKVAMTELRRNVTSVPGAGMSSDVSLRWLYANNPNNNNAEEAKFYSFNAPVGAAADQQCGRGVYTDIHVSSGDASGGTFPQNCSSQGYTPQEKALLFLMMDLASCIQDESKPPVPPPSDPGVR